MSEVNPTIDIYPMPFFVVLGVDDVVASSKWYQEALGFHHVFSIPGPGGEPALIHLRWAKYADLLIRNQTTPAQNMVKGVGLTLNFNMIGMSVDDLAGRARQYGARIVSEPKNQPWNARDFSVADPDGFILTFTQGPVDASLGMDQILPRAGKQEP